MQRDHVAQPEEFFDRHLRDTRNMVERYNDIDTVFPDEIDAHAFPCFTDW